MGKSLNHWEISSGKSTQINFQERFSSGEADAIVHQPMNLVVCLFQALVQYFGQEIILFFFESERT